MVRLQPEFALQRKHHRALSARLARKQRPLSFKRGRESNGVVERETEGFMGLVSALPAVEQVLLQVVADSKQAAARGVGCSVYAIGARSAFGNCSRKAV